MRFEILYRYETRVGTFFIGRSEDGRFHPLFEGESLGSYDQDFHATEDLAGGHTISVPGVEDTAALGIPERPSEWERMRRL